MENTPKDISATASKDFVDVRNKAEAAASTEFVVARDAVEAKVSTVASAEVSKFPVAAFVSIMLLGLVTIGIAAHLLFKGF